MSGIFFGSGVFPTLPAPCFLPASFAAFVSLPFSSSNVSPLQRPVLFINSHLDLIVLPSTIASHGLLQRLFLVTIAPFTVTWIFPELFLQSYTSSILFPLFIRHPLLEPIAASFPAPPDVLAATMIELPTKLPIIKTTTKPYMKYFFISRINAIIISALHA